MVEIRHKDTGDLLCSIDAEDLIEADLSDKVLTGANLTTQNLTGANLNGAVLDRADLTNTDMTLAKMRGASLCQTRLDNTNLTGAELQAARFENAIFIRCSTLHLAIGLDEVEMIGHCAYDAETLRENLGLTPLAFFQPVGFTQELTQDMGQAVQVPHRDVQYRSCFISYARSDERFVNRLCADLMFNNVPYWIDVRDVQPGEYVQTKINEAIEQYDKVLLVCSEASVTRKYIAHEVLQAIKFERLHGVQKLVPVMIDKYIMSQSMESYAASQTATGEWKENWLWKVQALQIGDFCDWKSYDSYKEQLDRVLLVLKRTH